MDEPAVNNQAVTTRLYAEVTDRVCTYIADCRFDDSRPSAGNILLALEYAYQPHPRFWRDLDIVTVVDAIRHRFPDWSLALEETEQSADCILGEVQDAIFINALDEANGEMLLAIPESERPTTPESAFTWIEEALYEKGLQKELQYARRDGSRCGDEALNSLHRHTQAQRGIVVERLGTSVARTVRNAAMKVTR